MMASFALLAIIAQAAQDTAMGRPCVVIIESGGEQARQVETAPGQQNIFAGGGVRLRCQGTQTTLTADSMAWYGGQNRLDLVRMVRMRDTAIALDANFATYYRLDERLDAHNNVVAVNRRTGSVLRGPNLAYYRAAQGIRDTVELRATGRPTIEYRSAADTGAAEPYLIVADRVRFKGDDRMWGGGKVTIDRRDFAARGDSVMLDETAGLGVLVGSPSIEGKEEEHYTLVGTRIELGLDKREIRLVKALGAGEATSADWRLTADTIHLGIERRKLQQAFAWGDSSRPHAVSTLNAIQSDSLALDIPDQVFTEARAFGRALSTAKRDSAATAADLDWIAGDTIVAHFVQEQDSGEASARTRIQRILASGSARALTHHYDVRDSTLPPSINYSRGRRIAIALKGEKIDRVIVSGRADGVQLDARPAPPQAPADTTKPSPTP
ncbi:MAG: hypothetical protein HYS40_03795 [Gemmatimonadetes bacterium]|nr:hypothetical protein [Gemmatimonadota bacterium]